MATWMNIDQNWLFTKDEAKLDTLSHATFEQINLPHTWNGLDGQDGGNDYHRAACWYQKALEIDNGLKGKRLFIEFEGANSVTNVYLNGVHLGEHKGGYSTFRFDITEHVKFGVENTLNVSVDNSHNEDIYPLVADFTFMGGLYRHVNLIAVDDIHFDLMDCGSQGVFVSQKKVSEAAAELGIKGKIVNTTGSEKAIELKVDFIDADGKTVESATKLQKITSSEELELDMTIGNPTLWQGVENPYLYTAKVTLCVDGNEVDSRSIQTGLRYYHVDPAKGFFLNGKHVRLNGVSRHQDRVDIGWALTEKEQIEDMDIIKEMGSNSIRLAHYQHNQFFYDLCDREGMVVWAEIPYISVSSKTDLEGVNAKFQMVELVRQNYNHACICFWGVQNEITIAGKLNNLENIVTDLNKLTKEEDPYRLTTQAQVGHLPDEDSMNFITDTMAYNKYYGWYYNEVEEFDTWLTEFKQKNPSLSLGISEYGCEGILAYHTDEPQRSDYTEEYQALYHEKVLQIFDKHENIWGTYVWNMFDFASDLRDEGGVQGMNNKGLVSHDRTTRKDSFYWYKANWATEPFVHITAKRFIDRPTEKINVKIYSNLDMVTLFINGEEFGKLVSDNHVFEFEGVQLKEGENTIKAVNGKYEDTATFMKVAEANPTYKCAAEKKNTMDVANWFGDIEMDTDVQPLEFPEGYFSIKDSISIIMEVEAGDDLINKYMKGLVEHPMFEMAKGFSIEGIAQMQPDAMDEVLLYNINKELNKIAK